MIQCVGLLLRLAEIDALEHDPSFGQPSRLSLAELAFNQLVTWSEPAVFAGRCGAKRTCGEMALSVGVRYYLTTSHNAV